MSTRVPIKLDDVLRRTLEAEADARGVPLDVFLSERMRNSARQLRRERIREQSEAVGRYIASNPEAQEFAEFWGTPRMDALATPPKLC
jgi:hypothetical protein